MRETPEEIPAEIAHMTVAEYLGCDLTSDEIRAFIDTVMREGTARYRDFAWRRTSDPYAVLVSEVMLQQTQVKRVERYFESWMVTFPTVDALASASVSDVLERWQGLGYNRRALMLKRTAEIISEDYGGIVPTEREDLLALPGVGPATAAGIEAFALNEPTVYLETNTRTVVLRELFPDEEKVSDRTIAGQLAAVALELMALGIEPRTWYYAMLDYGAWLKKAFPNPSRRSKHHTRQSAYEGSRRQKRAALLRLLLATPDQTATELAGTSGYNLAIVEDILADLVDEGFLAHAQGRYRAR